MIPFEKKTERHLSDTKGIQVETAGVAVCTDRPGLLLKKKVIEN